MPLNLEKFLKGEEAFVHDTGIRMKWVDQKLVNVRGFLPQGQTFSLSSIPKEVFPTRNAEGLKTPIIRNSQKRAGTLAGKPKADQLNVEFAGEDLAKSSDTLQRKQIFESAIQVSPVLTPIAKDNSFRYQRMSIVIPDRLIVVYKGGVDIRLMRANIQSQRGFTLNKLLSNGNPDYDVFTIKTDRTVPLADLVEAREQLLKMAGIKEVRYDNMPVGLPMANVQSLNPALINQWYLPEHNMPTSTPGASHPVSVGIIDFGCAPNHEALNNWVPPGSMSTTVQDVINDFGSDFLPGTQLNGHGTAVAGLIGMDRPDFKGVFPQTGLISFNLISDYSDAVISLMIHALAGQVDVINMSLDGTALSQSTGGYNPQNFIGAFQEAQQAGTLVVVSSGNQGDLGLNIFAQMPGTMAVGAMRKVGTTIQPRDDSSFSPPNAPYGLSVMAAGQDLLTTDVPLQDGYVPLEVDSVEVSSSSYFGYNAEFGQTSGAAPFVSGLAAMLLAHYPSTQRGVDTTQKIRRFIEQSAREIDPQTFPYQPHPTFTTKNWHHRMGYGMIDGGAALQLVKADLNMGTPGTPEIPIATDSPGTPENPGNSGGNKGCMGLILAFSAGGVAALHQLLNWLT